MRKLLWLVAIIFLFGCSLNTAPSSSGKAPDPMSLREELNRIVNRQISRDPFSFSIILGGDPGYRFVGVQKGTDWTLKSEGTGEPIKLTKKGSEIELVLSKNTEKLSERQFGLISPRDHLLLLQEAADRIKPVSSGDPNIQGMEITLDKNKIGQIVEQQMGSREAAREIARHASQKIQVRYLLWYRTDNRELTRMEIHLDSSISSSGLKKHVLYILRDP